MVLKPAASLLGAERPHLREELWGQHSSFWAGGCCELFPRATGPTGCWAWYGQPTLPIPYYQASLVCSHVRSSIWWRVSRYPPQIDESLLAPYLAASFNKLIRGLFVPDN